MSTIETSPACYDVPRVTAVQTLPHGAGTIRLPGLALWVAQGDPSIKILGGWHYTDALSKTEPVSLRKVYV